MSPVLWIALERQIRCGGWLGFFVLLAPLLGPRSYGVFTLAMTGIAVVEAVLARSTAAALDELAVVDDAHLSTAFVATSGIGAAVSLLLYGAAGVMAKMFDDGTVADIFQSLSLLPLLGALTAIPVAVLRRRRSYAALAISTLIGVCAGGVVGVMLARIGAGAWSLVAQIVTQRFVEIAILWGGVGQLIGMRWSQRHFADLAAAATRGGVRPMLDAVAEQTPLFLIGIVLGPIAVGLYIPGARLFGGLVESFLVPLMAAAPLVLQRATLADAAGWQELGRLVRRAGFVALPAAIGAAALIYAGLPALLDPPWWNSVLPAELMVLGAVPAVFGHVRRALLGIAGDGAVETRARVIETAAAILAVGVTAHWGLVAVAAALLGCETIGAIGSLWILHRRDRRFAGLAAIALQPCAAALGAGAAVMLFQTAFSVPPEPSVALPLFAGAGALVYAALLSLLNSRHIAAVGPRRWRRPLPSGSARPG